MKRALLAVLLSAFIGAVSAAAEAEKFTPYDRDSAAASVGE